MRQAVEFPAPETRRRWQLCLLGTLDLRDAGGETVRIPGAKAAQLLARLALPPQRAFSREELIELLWPGVAIDVGRNRLRQLLSSMRTLLQRCDGSPLLEAEHQTLRLKPGALDSDVARFEAAVRARQPDAATLYTGELLPGHYEDWVLEERRRLAALAERPEVAEPVPRPPLPRYLTRLLGADSARQQLCEAVRSHRLVTLVGPGGVGKTRLAVEVAQVLQDAGEPFQRIDFVSVAACVTAADLIDALLVAFGLPGQSGPELTCSDTLGSLRQALASRRMLVVLDNCEQLVDKGGPMIASLAAQLPHAHWLITSRRVLGLDGEREFGLQALALPAARASLSDLARNPAVALLLDRAQAVQPGLRLHTSNAEAITALVRALDGLPLAIELVATRLRSLAPEALLDALQERGEPALALLARSGHDERHASMLKVVRWSWSLLSQRTQQLLVALSVFEGGFSLKAASAVSGSKATLGLDEAVQHSMLQADPKNGRFAMYEVIREVAALHADAAQRAALRCGQRRWMIQWAQALPTSPHLRDVRRELRNIAAALASAARDQAPRDALLLFDALQRALSDISLPPTARTALAECLQALPAGPQRAAALAALARATMRAGDGNAALRLADAAMADLPILPAGHLARAVVLARVAHIHWRLRRQAIVATWLDEALVIARAQGAVALEASVLSIQGAIQRPRDPMAAATLQRQAVAAWRSVGDLHGVNTGRYNLAVALSAKRESCVQALAEISQVRIDTRVAEDWGQLAFACNLQGELLSKLRRWDEAVAAYREGAAVAADALELLPLAYCLWNLPAALAHQRQPKTAGRLMGFAARFWVERFGALNTSDRRELQRLKRLVGLQGGAAAVDGLLAQGAELTMTEALRLALD